MKMKNNLTLSFFLFTLAIFFALVSGLCYDTYAEGMTPQQVAEMAQVGGVVISEDGQYLLYVTINPADPLEENVPARQSFFLIDKEADETREIELKERIGNLAVRPGNGTFSFTASGPVEETEEEGENESENEEKLVSLFEYNPLTNDVYLVHQHETNILTYTWHPSGEKLALISREQLDLPENPLPYEPTVYEENLAHREGYIVSLNKEEAVSERIRLDGTLYLMEWSPAGDRLAVSETPTPLIDDYYMFQKVKIIDGETAKVINEIDNEGKLGQIVWSPDGSHLALRAGNDINDPIDGRIMVVSSEGGAPENIYPGFLGKFEKINWREDGLIYFIASESTARSFGTITPDGSSFNRIIDTDGPMLMDFQKANDGTTAFLAQTWVHPNEVFLLEPGNNIAERLTTTNDWLTNVRMGRQEVVSYEARDGRNIEGLLIYPIEENGGPYPTIVMVHGGPEAHYSNGWLTAYSLPGQVGAARGYAVFYPNYRGSTGRGLEFIRSSQADLAGAEFDDIVDGVDYLINQGITDHKKVGVTGGSYGGYATAWMSTRYSDRFAAGVMFVGISNNISKWGTSDIPEELYLVHSHKRIWDNWLGNLHRSPIYHVDNSQTPLLILHGEEDTRVHPSQSLELYRHIKVRKPEVPVRLIWYPGEGHGNINATSRFDYNLRMLRWFDTYLSDEKEPQMPDFYLDLEALGVEMP